MHVVNLYDYSSRSHSLIKKKDIWAFLNIVGRLIDFYIVKRTYILLSQRGPTTGHMWRVVGPRWLRNLCGPRNNFAEVLSITGSGNLFFGERYDFGTKISVFSRLRPANSNNFEKWPTRVQKLDHPILSL